MPFRDVVSEVLTRADIVQLISEYIPLKKSGRAYKALCPFHSEKTPSFNVVPQRSFFYCFGCGKGGNALNFLQYISGLSFYEALEKLAEKTGVQIQKDENFQKHFREVSQRKGELLKINRIALKFFEDCLNEEEGKICRDYLSSRLISPETIRKFSLGYSKDCWDGLYLEIKRKEIPVNLTSSLGLIIEREGGKNGFYDRFRGRLIFPVYNLAGEVIAFGGRGLLEKQDEPKYINSPDSELFKKGEILYGIYQAKDAIRKNGYSIVVEGYMDVLSMVQAGYENTIAPMGTALTLSQIRLLQRFAPKIILLMDGDEAGKKASLKSVESIIESRAEGFIATLPLGYDPDSFLIKYGKENVENLLQNALPALDFALKEFKEKYGESPPAIAKILGEIGEIISLETDPLVLTKYKEEIAKKLSLRVEEVQRFIRQKITKHSSLNEIEGYISGKEKQFLELLIYNPMLLDTFLEKGGSIEWIQGSETREIINFLMNHLYKTTEELLEGINEKFPPGKVKNSVINIFFQEKKYSSEHEEKALVDIMNSLRNDFIGKKMRELKHELETEGNEKKKGELLKKIFDLTTEMKKKL